MAASKSPADWNEGIKMQRARQTRHSPAHLEEDVVDSNSLFKGAQLLLIDERVVGDQSHAVFIPLQRHK